MSTPHYHIPRLLTIQLLHLAQLSPEQEVCGLIGAENGNPRHCYPISNIAEHAHRQFLLDPAEQLSTMKTMREKGEELFAIYHSHPTAPAIPSTDDITMNAYPNALYLIISLNTKGILEMRGFKLQANQYTEVELALEN